MRRRRSAPACAPKATAFAGTFCEPALLSFLPLFYRRAPMPLPHPCADSSFASPDYAALALVLRTEHLRGYLFVQLTPAALLRFTLSALSIVYTLQLRLPLFPWLLSHFWRYLSAFFPAWTTIVIKILAHSEIIRRSLLFAEPLRGSRKTIDDLENSK